MAVDKAQAADSVGVTRTWDDPPWLTEAKRHLGEREVKGPKHNAKIVAWWAKIFRRGIKDDETPWCAAFVGACLEEVGIASSRYESAASYEGWGVKLPIPVYGAVAVLVRPGGGHVGFVVGTDNRGNIALLGGNQGDAVNVSLFPRARFVAFRWPKVIPLPQPIPPEITMPLVATAQASTSEA